MNVKYENIRLEKLLSHTSGMRANLPGVNSYQNSSLDIESQRQKMAEEALILRQEVEQGNFRYSNFGYMVAGVMMERVTSTSWETLLENNALAHDILNNLNLCEWSISDHIDEMRCYFTCN